MDPAAEPPPEIQRAALHLYQLYDIADALDLERARASLAAPSARVRPVASRGGSIDIPQLPLEVSLGAATVRLGECRLRGQLYARVYDLGILALRLVLPLEGAQSWERVAALMADAQPYPAEVARAFEESCATLRRTLAPAAVRPNTAMRAEDYTILLVERLGAGAPAARLARHPALLQAALGERKPLSAAAQSLATPLSYYEDDLILLTWSAALIIEPDAAAREDAALLLEFANAQLLAFRSYDDQVERDLARIVPRIAGRERPLPLRLRSSGAFLREIHTLIADITDTSARVENALKVSEDVYWNRVYAAAVATLRIDVWRAGLAETLAVLRETAALLNDEAQARLASLLEVLVIVLIAVEVVVALIGLRGAH